MKAMISDRYGPPDVLELRDIDRPAVEANQVLVRIHASSVNAGDWHLLRADPFLIRLMGFGLLKPKARILGADIAGVVEEVGANVTEFRPGDEVFGGDSSIGASYGGGFAEYVAVTEEQLVRKPSNVSFEEAAAVPNAAFAALQAVRDQGKVQDGTRVVVNGASGGVGTFAVQIAKALGAEVTGVCSTRNVDMVRSIGADHVVDYTKEDLTQNGQTYDVIIDAAGYRSVFDYKRVLSPDGIYVFVGGATARMFQTMFAGPWSRMTGGPKMSFLVSEGNKPDLVALQELLEAEKIKPVIDRRFELAQVPDAIRYLEKEHARGKVVISV